MMMTYHTPTWCGEPNSHTSIRYIATQFVAMDLRALFLALPKKRFPLFSTTGAGHTARTLDRVAGEVSRAVYSFIRLFVYSFIRLFVYLILI